MNETTAKRSKAEVMGIIGFIFSLVAISMGVEFSIAGLILCNLSLKGNPAYSLARAGRGISIAGIAFVTVAAIVALGILATTNRH